MFCEWHLIVWMVTESTWIEMVSWRYELTFNIKNKWLTYYWYRVLLASIATEFSLKEYILYSLFFKRNYFKFFNNYIINTKNLICCLLALFGKTWLTSFSGGFPTNYIFHLQYLNHKLYLKRLSLVTWKLESSLFYFVFYLYFLIICNYDYFIFTLSQLKCKLRFRFYTYYYIEGFSFCRINFDLVYLNLNPF